MTPAERAEKITAGWKGLILAASPTRADIHCPQVSTDFGGVVMARQLIAEAIREAVAAERQRCAQEVEEAYPPITGPGWLAQEVRRDHARELARMLMAGVTTQ